MYRLTYISDTTNSLPESNTRRIYKYRQRNGPSFYFRKYKKNINKQITRNSIPIEVIACLLAYE